MSHFSKLSSIHVLRFFIYTYLYVHLYMQFRELVTPFLAILFFCLSIIYTYGVFQLRIRFILCQALLFFQFLLIPYCLHWSIRIANAFFLSNSLDLFLFEASIGQYILFLPIAIMSSLFFTGYYKSLFIKWEIFIIASFAAILFYNQSYYQITLYSHPSYAALSLLFFCFALFGIAFFKDMHGKASSKRHRVLGLFLLIPFLLIFLMYLILHYNVGSTAARSGLMRTTLFQFDFSQYVELKSEIETSDDLVLLFRKHGSTNQYLMRRYIMNAYSPQKGFYHDPSFLNEEGNLTVPDGRSELTDYFYKHRSLIKQDYYYINFDASSFLAMNYPVAVIPYRTWPNSSFTRVYSVDSMVTTANIWHLAQASWPNSENLDLEHYTSGDIDESIIALSHEICSESFSYYEKISAIYHYLKNEYYYSLKPGIAVDMTQLEHFLFVSKKGYCSYFAFAMALLCRAQGIPARVAVGFFLEAGSEILSFFPIKANMAHAWVEVYFDDYGWIEFDPTSSEIADGEHYDFGFTNPDEVEKYIEEIIDNIDSLTEAERIDVESQFDKNLFTRRLEGFKDYLTRFWVFIVSLVYLIVMPLLHFRYSLIAKIKKTSRDRCILAYYQNIQYLKLKKYQKHPYESKEDFALRLSEMTDFICFHSMTKLYQKARFSYSFSKKDYKLFVHEQKILHSMLYKNIFSHFSFYIHPIKILTRLE